MTLRNQWLRVSGTVVLAVVVIASLFSLQPEIAPIDPPQTTHFSAASIARGKTLAALGDCSACHTRAGGAPNSGGLAMDTPFGTIYTSNITPDVDNGIGRWSYPAFLRAMRYGIDRRGNYLYPAFPYTAFTHTSNEDLQDLYAFLMSQPAVSDRVPETRLTFPFNIRQGMAAWNWLFLHPGERAPDPQHDAVWNRGAYLAEGLGHCSACHSPRNLAAAEKQGDAFLSGGIAEGWVAPALNARSPAPVTWNEAQFQHYFRYGFSPEHGVAAGPMGPVIGAGLAHQSEDDLRALAHWLMSFQAPAAGQAATLIADAEQRGFQQNSAGARQYAGSCMACHSQQKGPHLSGVRPSLVLNSNLYTDSPENLIRIVLDGIDHPATQDLGTMPGFRHQLSDRQIATLLNWMRTDLAGQTPWNELEQKVAEIRQQPQGAE
ncbi:cytochrome c [Erwinia persicina]|uniref:cytochrome c n=1 Tax=Erwinia persicina TaxID=55211 RepID=UPI00177C5BA4|nr:cytochrome c [Erwinia persicina]MBD8163676.1 cytochrome c [Erwinia persicina]MBD8213832.1 cytochrome c [Erwinia persicina]